MHMSRNIISILVENHAGVLSHVTGLFSRRGYNIDSLSVGVTENPDISRITIVARGDDAVIEQIVKQLNKLIDVVKVMVLAPQDSVYRELAMIKVTADTNTRPAIISIVDIFRANIIDVSATSITVEITGDQGKQQAFIALMEPYGIREIVRTGITALQRGCTSIED